MQKQNDPTDRKLPVTAEVGGEGGSYADATLQVETFSGPAGNVRADPALVGAPDAGESAGAVDAGQGREDDAVVKHATEPPESRTP
jgi:hypothetical protein